MKVLRIYESNINERFISEAVEALRQGDIIIYPTDTSYGIAADALNKKGVERLCSIKGLENDKNLFSIVCSDISQAAEFVRIDNNAFSVLRRYLPGPYTFILPASSRLPKVFRNRKTIGLRIPDNKIALFLAKSLNSPLLTTSVDISDDNPEAAAEADNLALIYRSDVALVLDGGTGKLLHSTIIDLTDAAEPVLVREGAGTF